MSHSISPDHAAGHEHGHDEHENHGSLRSYLTGFVLALAVVQILVHVIFFLHLDTRSEGGWNLMAFIFTIVLVVIVLGASIWVMYNEDTNMMPMSPQYHHRGQDT